LVDGGLGRN